MSCRAIPTSPLRFFLASELGERERGAKCIKEPAGGKGTGRFFSPCLIQGFFSAEPEVFLGEEERLDSFVNLLIAILPAGPGCSGNGGHQGPGTIFPVGGSTGNE